MQVRRVHLPMAHHSLSMALAFLQYNTTSLQSKSGLGGTGRLIRASRRLSENSKSTAEQSGSIKIVDRSR